MITLFRTDSSHPHFEELVRLLDAELAERDGSDNSFYAKYNKVHMIKHAVVAYGNGLPAGCGAMKTFGDDAMEIKRMFTLPEWRGKGLASAILAELEAWAASLHYRRCVLETGKRQPEAIALYTKSGYSIIPNYGQYAGVDNSVCFAKMIG